MWSLINNIVNRLLDRPRIKLNAVITSSSDRPPYSFKKKVLLITLQNPSPHDINIEKIVIEIRGIPWILNPQLEGIEIPPPFVIKARDKSQYWLDAIEVAKMLIEYGEKEGVVAFDVEVTTTQEKQFRTKPIELDLDWYADQIEYLEQRENARILSTIRSHFEEDDPIAQLNDRQRQCLINFCQEYVVTFKPVRNRDIYNEHYMDAIQKYGLYWFSVNWSFE